MLLPSDLWPFQFQEFFFALSLKLRQQADDQESTLVAQEEEVHGKKRELESLKEEEKTLLEDIKKTERELQKLEQNLNTAQELRREVISKTFLISVVHFGFIHLYSLYSNDPDTYTY